MKTTSDRTAVIVQLPFPSQAAPDPHLQSYYTIYSRLYSHLATDYQMHRGDLWEAPLWVAHLDGALGRSDTELVDLSRIAADTASCVTALLARLSYPSYLLFSPLAQNFDLAISVSRMLRAAGHITVLGGNMAKLAKPEDFDVVFFGHADSQLYKRLEERASESIGEVPSLGVHEFVGGFRPRYRLLKEYSTRVPLVRINASHGCLLQCTFCGDGWSRQLHVVPVDDLARELDDIEATFPNIQWLYVGDKTFGQSNEAVDNLIRVLASRRGRYRIIVQTHVSLVTEKLLDSLDRLAGC